MPESIALDQSASFDERWDAMYELTWKRTQPAKVRHRILLEVALDASETVDVRKAALTSIAQFPSVRRTHALLPILLDESAPWELRAEVAHVLGMTRERRPFAARALMDAWKTAPPMVRVYIAYAFACIGHPRFIPLLRESVNDLTMSDLRWTLAQECRWAITCCRNVHLENGDWPDSPAFLSPTWERETQYRRAKGRSVRPR